VDVVVWAWEHSEQALARSLPRRWRHVRGVALKAEGIAGLPTKESKWLQAAAILHDIGYAPGIDATGFHPLDGARHLAALNAPKRLVNLVANHSCSAVEARLRGLGAELAEFEDERSAVRDALWFCDVTTSPDGLPVTPQTRFREIKERYGADHVVTRFIDEASEELLGAVARTEQRLQASK